MKRIVLLLPVASYRNEDFLAAAQALQVEVIPVADYCPQLAPSWGMDALSSVHFDQPFESAPIILERVPGRPDAVLAVDDHGLELAALLRERLGLPGNSVASVARTRDKLAFRQLLRANGFLCPDFTHVPDAAAAEAMASKVTYPVVVKARRLSSSRGVIRADTAQECLTAVRQVCAIQNRADRESKALGCLIESFIPGQEYALEGVLRQGKLQVLALFDKPDPLDGPYFEETIYVTPSRLPLAVQNKIADQVAQTCQLAGLVSGPIHAEMRVNERGIWLLEVAARSIGGLCGRMLRHALGMSLEEVLLRDVLGLPLPHLQPVRASGVMMIPIPKRGIFQAVHGLPAARCVAGITGIEITTEPGAQLLPPPEGAAYLGFIFALADSPQAVEQAMRDAHARLRFEIQTELPVGTV